MEVLVVISVLAMLGAIAVPQVASNQQRAKEQTLRSRLILVRAALYSFYADTGCFPYELQELDDSVSPPECFASNSGDRTMDTSRFRGPYLPALELDPVSNKPFVYNTGDPPPYFLVKSSASGNDSRGTPYSSY